VSGGAASRLDDASRRIVGRAAQVAGALQDTLVEPRHLLVAMLLDGDPRLVGALARGGTTLDGLVEKFVGAERWRFAQRHALRRALTTLGPVPDGGNPALDGWSPHARKVIAYAAVEADALGHEPIQPAHLLLGLIHAAPGGLLGGIAPYPAQALLAATTALLGATAASPTPRATLEQSVDRLLRSANENLRRLGELRDGPLDETIARLEGVSNRFRDALGRAGATPEGAAPPAPNAPRADGSHPGVTIWDGAHVREGATIGIGTSIGRGAYVGPDVVIGRNCKLQNLALVYEPAVLGDGVFVGPGAVLTNDLFPRAVNPDLSRKTAADWHAVGVTVRDGASIGARAVCVAPVTIGAWAMVGAGAVVVSDVPAHALVVGSPARQIGWVGRAGHRLVEQSNGRWRCDATGETYLLIDGAMAPANLRREQPPGA